MTPFKPSVRCGHCAGATSSARECPRCHLTICEVCPDIRARCRAPRQNIFELGKGQRAIAVNQEASKVLASDGRQSRVFDLDAAGAVETDSRLPAWDVASFDDDDQPRGSAVENDDRRIALCGCGGHVTRLHSDETISHDEIDGPRGGRAETVRARALEKIAYDCQRRQLAVTTHDGLHIFGCDDNHQIDRRQATVRTSGPIVALLFRHDLVAALVDTGSSEGGLFRRRRVHRLLVFRARDGGLQTMPTLEWQSGKRQLLRTRGDGEAESRRAGSGPVPYVSPLLLAISARGRVAVAISATEVMTFDVTSGAVSRSGGHDKPIVFLGFADEALVSADEGGRLVVREPDGAGYASV